MRSKAKCVQFRQEHRGTIMIPSATVTTSRMQHTLEVYTNMLADCPAATSDRCSATAAEENYATSFIDEATEVDATPHISGRQVVDGMVDGMADGMVDGSAVALEAGAGEPGTFAAESGRQGVQDAWMMEDSYAGEAYTREACVKQVTWRIEFAVASD
jgi:hypothetical protein